jgi:phosphoribosylaminoimidazole (AIR) synthetase
MILICSKKEVPKIKKALEEKREKVYVIGQIKKGKRSVILKDSL